MDKATDVERLFSWLKTQDLQYREFAASREISDAVATWPALHQAAAGTGRAADAAAPAGDAAAKERIARERAAMPPAAAEAIRAGTPSMVPPPPLAGGRLLSALGRRMQTSRHDLPPEAETTPTPDGVAPGMPAAPPGSAATDDPAAQERARAAAERLRERLDAAMAVNPRPSATPETDVDARGAAYAAPGRAAAPAARSARAGRFFGGTYSGGEETYRDPAAANVSGGSRREHSRESVFSRLSGGRTRALPDPRERSRGSAGLGSVFNRLR